MAQKVDEKRIAELMKSLDCSREEALDIILYDEEVEDGTVTRFDWTDEQKANKKEMARKIDHKKMNGVKRERKPNELKEAIVAELAELLSEEAQGQVYENVKVTNPNRMIAFSVNGKNFELTLVEKRAPKK
jgi:hypothetical protein